MTVTTIEKITEGHGILADARIIGLTAFVHDLSESREFYTRILGLHVLEEGPGVVRLDAGSTVLSLMPATTYGVRLRGKRDDSSDTVFLVDDIEAARIALESRGLVFARRRTYEVGKVIDFYDPNGHRLMLYEPSPKALTWPSGPKLKAIWRAFGRGGSDLIGPPSGTAPAGKQEQTEWGLDGKPLAYFFIFVDDEAKASELFERSLGSHALEKVHCCFEGCPKESRGVIKYECGGVVLTTHHLHGEHFIRDDNGIPYGVRDFDPKFAKGVAPVFGITGIEAVVDELEARGVGVLGEIERTADGAMARFEVPSGHMFFLFEPLPDSTVSNVGKKLRQLLTAEL